MQVLKEYFRRPELVRLSFSPDGRYLAAGDQRSISVWDLAAGTKPLWYRVRPLHRGFAFSPDGTAIVGGYGTWFQRYDVLTAAETRDPFLNNFKPDRFSPDGRFALARKDDSAAGVVHVRLARVGPEGWVEGWRKELKYDSNSGAGSGELLFSADCSRIVRVWALAPVAGTVSPVAIQTLDSESGDSVAEWTGALPVSAFRGAASPTGAVVLLRGAAFYAIDTTGPSSKHLKQRNGSPKHFTAAAFSRDGRWLATTSNDTAATVWNTTTWEVQRRYEWQIGRLLTVCFAPDGLRCAAGSHTGQIVVWDLDD